MSYRPKTPTDYDKLRAIWYDKLKKAELKKPENERFTDIEQVDGQLKTWSAKFDTVLFKNRAARNGPYYDLAQQFLNDYEFKSNRERIIWEYHANGFSEVSIAGLLKKLRIKMNRDAVRAVILPLKEKMKAMYLSGYKSKYE